MVIKNPNNLSVFTDIGSKDTDEIGKPMIRAGIEDKIQEAIKVSNAVSDVRNSSLDTKSKMDSPEYKLRIPA